MTELSTEDLGTTRWFGESWGAPVCDPRTHIETPVGLGCIGHDHMHPEGTRSPFIEPGDQGITMPLVSRTDRVERVAYHLDCWLHEIGVDRLPRSSEPREPWTPPDDIDPAIGSGGLR